MTDWINKALENPIAVFGSLGVVAAAIWATWGHIKTFFSQMWGRLIATIEITDYEMKQAIGAYLFHYFKRSPFSPREYRGETMYVRPEDRIQLVGFEAIGAHSKLIWRGWRFLWISEPRAKDSGYFPLIMSYPRFMFDADKMILDAIEYYNTVRHGRDVPRYRVYYVTGKQQQEIQVTGGFGFMTDLAPSEDLGYALHRAHSMRLLQWDHEDLKPRTSAIKGQAPLDSIVCLPDMRGAIDEARRWYRAKNWYFERSVPWRRGWLLHGIPGTGKTTLARAVAEDLNMPIYVYDLASLNNHEMREAWHGMLAQTPCMALLEDIDAIFDGRTNKMRTELTGALTFDCLLNCIDGVERVDGLFLIITTNNLEKVDHALSVATDGDITSRPGRVDRVIELKKPDRAAMLVMARRVLPGHPEMWEAMIEAGLKNGDTICQFESRCIQPALQGFWDSETQPGKARAPRRYRIGKGTT